VSDKTLAEVAEKMRDIDIAILTTRTEGGKLAGRPMSSNRDVEYDGDSYYFAMDRERVISDIESDRNVSLAFVGSGHFYATVAGEAELIRARSAFESHWVPDLDEWFEDGVNTPGLVMIKVHANRIEYWDGMENGELTV
jgi:general stress protein 26